MYRLVSHLNDAQVTLNGALFIDNVGISSASTIHKALWAWRRAFTYRKYDSSGLQSLRCAMQPVDGYPSGSNVRLRDAADLRNYCAMLHTIEGNGIVRLGERHALLTADFRKSEIIDWARLFFWPAWPGLLISLPGILHGSLLLPLDRARRPRSV